MAIRVFRGVAVALAAGVLAGCGNGGSAGSWRTPNADLQGTRAVAGSAIDSSTAARLTPRWRFALAGKPTFAGIFASTPIADGSTVYIQDLQSDVYALDEDTGAVVWTHRYRAANDGPNGLVVAGGRVYGATDSDAFALSAETGEEIWRRHLTSAKEQLVDIAPVAWQDFVFFSTVGYAPFGRGSIYALDAATGDVRWRFDTIAQPWRHPAKAGGGGLRYPVSVDAHGLLYAGNSNPSPWGGSPELPNGAAFPGPVPHTDSLIVLDARSGELLWHDQVTPHDVRDYDFQATPILASVDGSDLVFGGGKAGRVIAWDRESHRRRWEAVLGLHRNDVGPLPRRRVVVCPGLFGGVQTPMAYSEGRLFVPVVDLCGWGSAVDRQEVTSVDPNRGRGRLVALDAASGSVLWERRLESPSFGCATVANDVVFTSTYDGTVYGFSAADGRLIWRTTARAGINACPAVVGDLLLIGAGVGGHGVAPELVAYGVG